MPTLNDTNLYCGQRHGFLFAKIRLDAQDFRVFNLLLSSVLLAALAVQAFFRLIPVNQTIWNHMGLPSIRS